jgi:hypothetical protein
MVLNRSTKKAGVKVRHQRLSSRLSLPAVNYYSGPGSAFRETVPFQNVSRGSEEAFS